MCDTYNGWANRETWCFMLHVNDDEGLSQAARDLMLGYADSWDREDALKDWAETLLSRRGYEAEYGDRWPDALADMSWDIGSVYRIDWRECVKALTEEG